MSIAASSRCAPTMVAVFSSYGSRQRRLLQRSEDLSKKKKSSEDFSRRLSAYVVQLCTRCGEARDVCGHVCSQLGRAPLGAREETYLSRNSYSSIGVHGRG